MNTPYTITHRAYQGSTDPDGYPTGDTYADPVQRQVFGWYPLSSLLNNAGDYDLRTVTSKILQVPDVSPYSPRDRVALPGDDVDGPDAFFVSQDVRDYNTGPFGFKPGGEVILEKVTG